MVDADWDQQRGRFRNLIKNIKARVFGWSKVYNRTIAEI
jgi:hypothetical protein